MSFCSSKREEDFSTNDQRETKSYSSRFSKAKSLKNNTKVVLPVHAERAAILIQRFWRNRMIVRRKYYSELLSELEYHNNAVEGIISCQNNVLNGLLNEISGLEAILRIRAESSLKCLKTKTKSLAKECVATAFKMEKRMLSEQEIKSLLEEKIAHEERINDLKELKKEIQAEMIDEVNEKKQCILREIKEANAQLLQIVSERNVIKHKLKEKAIEVSVGRTENDSLDEF